MEINPYSSPTETTAIRETSVSALGVALRLSVVAYLGAIVSFALLGCTRWVAFNAINSYRQSRTVDLADWWHEHFLMLVDGPLFLASAVFIYFATNKLVNGYSGFSVLIISRVLFDTLLGLFHLGAPRHLKGVHPMFYAVEIWGAIVPCVISALAILIWANLAIRSTQQTRSQP